MSLDPTPHRSAALDQRWLKVALNAFDITFDRRVTAGRK
jgi:hypothetical protein